MIENSVIVPLNFLDRTKIRMEPTPHFRLSVGKPAEADVSYSGQGAEAGIDVAPISPNFDDSAKAIEGIANSLTEAIKCISPKKAAAELGLEIQAEANGLTTLIIKSSGKATLNVTLERSN